MKAKILALVGMVLSAPVGAATLDFDGSICNGGMDCSNGFSIDQSYGDMAGVDVIYDGNPNDTTLNNFLFWGSQYSDLENIAYFADGAQLTLDAADGYEVTLSSLDLGAWPNTDRNLGFSVMDLSSNSTVFDTGLVTVSGQVRSSFSPNLTSSEGLKITFFGDFFNGGVDNIVYSASKIGTVNPVPLPAGVLLLGTALAGLGLKKRRSK